MFELSFDKLKERISRHRRVMAFALGILLVISISALLSLSRDDFGYFKDKDQAATISGASALAMPDSAPVKLRIPKLGIETTFEEPLGTTDNGAIEIPESYDKVAWYKHGPTPGEIGPAVILGHVDSYLGAAVFFRLGGLSEGDEIYVDREDGTTAIFEVTGKERPSQSDFPTDRVYGNLDHAGLRLITCSGIYNRGTTRYSHNLIVYAKLARVE